MEISNYIDEFTSSTEFLFLESGIREYAPAVFASFTQGCEKHGSITADSFTFSVLDKVLTGTLALLDLPLTVKRSVPSLLCGYFNYLASAGHYPPASAWTGWVGQIDKAYQERFRGDGSVKGETFTKKYTDVNRNDPCPCGSGKKFKKCCMGIL
jgi:hypothetical protein